MQHIFDLMAAILGMFTTAIVVYIAFYFKKVNMYLSNALALCFAGKAVAVCITTLFGLATLFDLYPLDPLITQTMRLTLYIATLVPSVFLLYAVHRIVTYKYREKVKKIDDIVI